MATLPLSIANGCNEQRTAPLPSGPTARPQSETIGCQTTTRKRSVQSSAVVAREVSQPPGNSWSAEKRLGANLLVSPSRSMSSPSISVLRSIPRRFGEHERIAWNERLRGGGVVESPQFAPEPGHEGVRHEPPAAPSPRRRLPCRPAAHLRHGGRAGRGPHRRAHAGDRCHVAGSGSGRLAQLAADARRAGAQPARSDHDGERRPPAARLELGHGARQPADDADRP